MPFCLIFVATLKSGGSQFSSLGLFQESDSSPEPQAARLHSQRASLAADLTETEPEAAIRYTRMLGIILCVQYLEEAIKNCLFFLIWHLSNSFPHFFYLRSVFLPEVVSVI